MRACAILLVICVIALIVPPPANASLLGGCKAAMKKGIGSKLDEEIQHYTLCLSLKNISNTERAKFFLARATAYYLKKEYDLALDDVNAARQNDPNIILILFTRGLIYSEKGEFENALRDFTDVLDRDPVNILALLNRGVLYEKMGQIENAKADFQKALNTGSGNPFVSQKAKQYGLQIKRPEKIPGTQILYELPDTFELAFEDSQSGTTIYQYVPKSEKLTDWSEMITITSTALAAPTESIADRTLDAILKGYSKICSQGKEYNYKVPEDTSQPLKESQEYPGYFLVNSNHARAGMVFCNGVDKSRVPKNFKTRNNGYIFVKVIETPYRVFSFQYEWQDDNKPSQYVHKSGKLENFVFPNILSAKIYLERTE